jgi:hypothetical protein
VYLRLIATRITPGKRHGEEQTDEVRCLPSALVYAWPRGAFKAHCTRVALYGVVGTGLLWNVSTLCAVVPPPGLYGVVGTGWLWDVSTLCAVVGHSP